uniref:(northern house mosquito) hypothetical protein n=1 Tax=Culex pipiens TaxID=7175 RepID=A0A8D8MR52_CULPI
MTTKLTAMATAAASAISRSSRTARTTTKVAFRPPSRSTRPDDRRPVAWRNSANGVPSAGYTLPRSRCWPRPARRTCTPRRTCPSTRSTAPRPARGHAVRASAQRRSPASCCRPR